MAEVREPKTYSETMGSNESRDCSKAITEEFNALEKNNTWQLVKRASNMKVIGFKWVSSIENATSIKPRYKARLCV